MDEIRIRALAYVLAREMKKYHHQKDVYLGVLQQLKYLGVDGVDELIGDAQKSEYIQARTEDAFAFLDEWLPPIVDIDVETVQRLWLEKWESGGREPN